MFSRVYETTSTFRFPEKTFLIFPAKTQNANGLASKQRTAAHCADGRVSLDFTVQLGLRIDMQLTSCRLRDSTDSRIDACA